MTKSRLNIVYMGTPDFAVAPLDAIVKAGHHVSAVITVPDKPAGRGRKVNSSAVKNYAVKHELPVLQPEKLRDANFIEKLRSLNPDIMVVVAFRMLPKVVWEIPRLGTFNLHASLLPQYRGAAPINWAVINGEKESGVTTFLIDEKIDTGAILLQEKVLLEEDETAGTLHDKLMELGSTLVVQTIEGLNDGSIKPVTQHGTVEIKAASKIFKDDCKIDWGKSGSNIESFIRGMSPFPGAFTQLSSKELTGQLKITKAKFISGEKQKDFPIVLIDGKKLFVQLKDGVLLLEQVQLQGKRSMNAVDFINGIRDKSQIFHLE